ncbi:clostripain-related cysteine peptidase [Butyrivibrio sp. WCD3002]|uniref:clostripain-related cysteine peptidase n=1 Tax=Butyrivibrio sp. WCD3002 TaxID=1280676 RepID=UPI0003FE7F9E|nr:clostripain-related cysteine peptidase [Butyrivibrio sp. WCD3002]
MAEPVRRKKNIEEGGNGVHVRGDGLGTGPVGSSDGYKGKGSGGGSNGGGPKRSGGISPLSIVVVLVILLLSGGGGLSSLFSDSSESDTESYTQTATIENSTTNNSTSVATTDNSYSNTTQSGTTSGSSQIGSLLGSLLGGGTGYYDSTSSEWAEEPNTGVLNKEVIEGAGAKRTVIKDDGSDVTTIMVYMCGTDLESRSAMATKDLQEMMAANISDQINIIVYTGGCKKWQNNVVSSSVNQIYKVEKGVLRVLKDDVGKKPMTDPDNLASFIKWTAAQYPANRYDLILWDHGGGSVSGYGYDEKNAQYGSMGLSGINRALKGSGVTFDFIGFDACLMATVETALMTASYGDYLIASEETEPGVGWYYTDWLNAYSANPSMATLEIGKNIIDGFTKTCENTCRGQKTTLSIIDLAELEKTIPDELKSFANSTSELISDKQYKKVSNARAQTREFAASTKIDQVDLVHLCYNMETEEGQELANAIRGCVKYNRTSQGMTNAYGLSMYFPYRKSSKVDSMVSTSEAIGMDESYSECIQKVASLQVAGQMAAGGTQTPAGSLFGDYQSSSSTTSSDALIELFTTMLSGSYSGISGLDASNTQFFGKGLDIQDMADYVSANQFDENALMFVKNDDGDDTIQMTAEQWDLVQDLEVNVFYDDGTRYVDLGLDNSYDIDDDGNPVAPSDRTWLYIDDQIVSYYHVDTQGDSDNYAIMGRVPVILNDQRADLILIFDSENEDGYVAGVTYDYVNGETDTVAKNLTELSEGDKLEYICDCYAYDKTYTDTYFLGDSVIVDGDMEDMHISNRSVGDGEILVSFRFTDIYGQEHWSQTLNY